MRKLWFLWVGAVSVVIIAGILFLFPKVTVVSGSMEQTLRVNDVLLISKLNTANLTRGDIIVFEFEDTDELYLKRIIGVPGDVITVLPTGEVFINEQIYEPYLGTVGGPSGTWEVPAGSYFCMGDNRRFSEDSRSWENPYVPVDKIVGKAVFIMSPLNRLGPIR